MSCRKSVRNISLNGISGGLVSAPTYDGRTSNNGEIACYGDTLYTTSVSPGPLHAQDHELVILDEGQADAYKALIGKNVSVTITTTYGNGDEGGDSNVETLSGKIAVMDVTGDSLSVDDYGESTIHIAFRKQAD